jgi:hypothetical protein
VWLGRLFETSIGLDRKILANDIWIRIDSQSRSLRHRDATAYRVERTAIELRFKIEVPPPYHCILSQPDPPIILLS